MAAPARAILASWMDQAQCQELVDYHSDRHRRVASDTDCWIFTARSVNGSGYPMVKSVPRLQPPGTGSVAFLLHRVALVARTGTDIIGEASHLCGVSLCFNPDHLVDEDHVTNETRKFCVGHLVCRWHGHPIGNFCKHTPGCIRPPREDLNCCLRLKESDPAGWALFEQSQLESVRSTAIRSPSKSLPPAPQPPESGERSSFSPSQAPPSSPPSETLTFRLRRSPARSPSSSLFAGPPSFQSGSPNSPVVLRSRVHQAARVHDPPTSPSSPERQRSRPRLGTSSPSQLPWPGTSPNESSSADDRRRSVRRPDHAPSTQHQQMMEDFFAGEEAEDTQYRREASVLRRGTESSDPSYYTEGSEHSTDA